MTSLAVKFSLNSLTFDETLPDIIFYFSQCRTLPEAIFFPNKGDICRYQKNDIRPFALFCIFCNGPKCRLKSEILLIFQQKNVFCALKSFQKANLLLFY